MDIMDEEEEGIDDICLIHRLMLDSDRYLNTRYYRKNRDGQQWKCYLYDQVETKESEFKVLFRMSRKQFWGICNLIEDYYIFGKKDTKSF